MRYFNTYLLVITANALKYKYTRLREYITVSDVVTCIGVITPVYYPSLVFLADFKSRDFLGLEMYAYDEHTSSNGKKKPSSPTRRHTKRQKKTERRSYYGIQSQFCFMSLEVSGYLGFEPRWWDIIYQHAYFLCDLAKFQSPLIQIHYYSQYSDIWNHTYRYYWIQSQYCFMVYWLYWLPNQLYYMTIK